MSVVIHVRVPMRLKERLEELGVNISGEVRRLLEERLAWELEEELRSTRRVRNSVLLIREDREKGRA